MTPTLVIDGDGVRAVFGGSGGFRIAPSVTEAVLAREIFHASPAAIVAAPRIYPTPDGKLSVEDSLPESVRAGLVGAGEKVDLLKFNINAVQVVVVDGTEDGREVSAVADPRKNGLSMAE